MQNFYLMWSRAATCVRSHGHYATRTLGALIVAPSLVILSSCATTSVDSQWVNSDFSGRKLVGKVMVIGLSRDDTVRRIFEDEMALQLSAYALTTVRSYEMIAEALVSDSTSVLLKAANSIGANTILSSVVVDRQYVERLIPQPLPLTITTLVDGMVTIGLMLIGALNYETLSATQSARASPMLPPEKPFDLRGPKQKVRTMLTVKLSPL